MVRLNFRPGAFGRGSQPLYLQEAAIFRGGGQEYYFSDQSSVRQSIFGNKDFFQAQIISWDEIVNRNFNKNWAGRERAAGWEFLYLTIIVKKLSLAQEKNHNQARQGGKNEHDLPLGAADQRS